MTHQLASIDALVPALLPGLEVCVTRDPRHIAAAQRLRYEVFYEEMGARKCARTRASQRDADDFDEVCDHLLAVADGAVVGTYRLVRRHGADAVGGFYSGAEFDIRALLAYPGEILELGRSCIHPDWRGRGVLNLLWQGIAAYIVEHEVSLLFGCASLPGTNVDALAPQLAYLRDYHLAPAALRARPLGPTAVDLGRFAATFDRRQGFLSLPPLFKGYLRAGGMISDGAVVDQQFNTTDILMVLDTAVIAERYRRRYGSASKPVAALG